MLMFTDFIDDLDIKKHSGYAIIGVIMCNFVVNILI